MRLLFGSTGRLNTKNAGFWPGQTEAEVDWAIDLTVKHVQRLRDMSPLYDMHLEGIDLKTVQWSQH